MSNPPSIAIRDANNLVIPYEPNLDPAKGAKQDAIAALLTVPTSFTTGQKKVTTTGTAVALSSESVPLKNGVVLQANPLNAAAMTVGPVGVNNTKDGTGNGKVLQPGQSWAFAVSDLDVLFINGTAGDWVDWSAN